MPSTLQFEVTEAPSQRDLAIVDDGLERANRAAAALDAVRPLACFARDGAGRVIGGARARTWGGACEVQQLWVEPALRRQGIARALMAQVEQAARARGVRVLYLDTFSFQARPLYERCGFRVAAQIEGFPDGIARYLMVKTLEDA